MNNFWNISKWIGIIFLGAGAIRTNIARWGLFSALNTAGGVLNYIAEFLVGLVRFFWLTAVISLGPILLGITIERFGMITGGVVAMIVAAITSVVVFYLRERLNALIATNPNQQATSENEKQARFIFHLLASILILLITGVTLFIYNGNDQEVVGRGLILAGCIFGNILCLIAYIKIKSGTIAIQLATNAGRAFSEKIPEVTRKMADELYTIVCGYMAWINFLAVFVCVFPIYKNLMATALLTTTFFFLAAAMFAGWENTARLRKLMITGALAMVVVLTVHIAWPEFTASVRSQISSVTVAGLSWSAEDDKIDAVILKIDQKEASTNLTILQGLKNDKAALESRIVTNGGVFSKQEAKRWQELKDDIQAAKSSDYLDRKAGIKSPSLWSRITGSSSNSSTTPQPTQTPPAVSKPAKTTPSVATRPKAKSRRSKRQEAAKKILAEMNADLAH